MTSRGSEDDGLYNTLNAESLQLSTFTTALEVVYLDVVFFFFLIHTLHI